MDPAKTKHYDLVMKAGIMRGAGHSFDHIAKTLGIGKDRARTLAAKFDRINAAGSRRPDTDDK